MFHKQLSRAFNRSLSGLFAGLVLAMCSLSAQASIVYTIDRTIGVGTVEGTITTDGTIGVLSLVNILSYNVVVTHPNLSAGSPVTLDSGTNNLTQIGGSALTATATDLLFNYGSGLYEYFYLYDGSTFWCNVAATNGCGNSNLSGAESVGFLSSTSQGFEQVHRGNVVIASTNVPEPASLALLSIAFVGLATTRRKKAV